MAGIHGAAYMVIGVLVAGFSKYVQERVESPGLTLFFYAGLLFIGVGVFKLILRYILKDKDTGNANKKEYSQPRTRPEEMKERITAKNPALKEKYVVPCPLCGTKHYSTSNYCHMCGANLK
jgi:hypothetical protein